MTTYESMKIVIAGGKKTETDLLTMSDVFLMNNRISVDEYNDLLVRIHDKYHPEQQ